MAKELKKQTCIYSMNPWHKFQPDDEQLLSTYLMAKIWGFRTIIKPGFDNSIPTVDFKTFHPEELIGLGEVGNQEWYCFTPMEAKSSNGTWSTSNGYWNPTGRNDIICNRECRAIGFKKPFGYYTGSHANGMFFDSDWKMEEYRISDDDSAVKEINKWILCKIYIEPDDAYDHIDDFFPDSLIRSIPNNVLKHLSHLVSSYQSLSLEDTGRGPQIVKSIIRISRQCKLDKVLTIPKECVIKNSAKQRDIVVGKVYSKIMEIESRLLLCGCGLHVSVDHQLPFTMETIATLINIASCDYLLDDDIFPLPEILAHTLGREIEDVYRGCGKGIAPDMELLRHITEASRCAITTFVVRNINRKWRIEELDNMAKILGFDKDQPPSQLHDLDRDVLIKFTDLFTELVEFLVRTNN